MRALTRRDCACEAVRCEREAVDAIERAAATVDFDGFVLDVCLGFDRGNHGGLRLAERVRTRALPAPVLIVSGVDDWNITRRANAMGVSFCAKPLEAVHFDRFVALVREYRSARSRGADALDRAITRREADRGESLTPAERRLLRSLLRGESQVTYASSSERAVGTVRVQVHRIRAKLGYASTIRMVAELWCLANELLAETLRARSVD